jgi:hypothetical protein
LSTFIDEISGTFLWWSCNRLTCWYGARGIFLL